VAAHPASTTCPADNEVVGDEQEARAARCRKAAEQRHHVTAQRAVQRAGRLVGDHQARLAAEREGDDSPLTHPAAQHVRVGTGTLSACAQTHRFQPPLGPGGGGGA